MLTDYFTIVKLSRSLAITVLNTGYLFNFSFLLLYIIILTSCYYINVSCLLLLLIVITSCYYSNAICLMVSFIIKTSCYYFTVTCLLLLVISIDDLLLINCFLINYNYDEFFLFQCIMFTIINT